MQLFIFYTQDKSFNDRVISLVLYRKVLQRTLFSPFLPNQKWHLLTNKMIYRHINAPLTIGGSAVLYVAE